jgi:hypothetical protein
VKLRSSATATKAARTPNSSRTIPRLALIPNGAGSPRPQEPLWVPPLAVPLPAYCRLSPQAVRATGRRWPGRSRPLCAYPSHAHYRGTGDVEDAASFECR